MRMDGISPTGEPGVFSFASNHDSNMVLQKAPQRANIKGFAEQVSSVL